MRKQKLLSAYKESIYSFLGIFMMFHLKIKMSQLYYEREKICEYLSLKEVLFNLRKGK